MQKSTNSHKRRNKLNFLIFASFLVLILLASFLETGYCGGFESSTQETGSDTEQMPSRTFEEARDSRVTSTSYENLSLFNKIRLYLDVYKVGGIVTALVILFIYPRVTWRESNLTKNSLKTLYPFKTRKVAGTEGTIQENFELRKRRFLTAIPILCIALAEMLIFLGAIKIAIFIHIGSLIALSLSNIYIHNPETQKIYQALMLLPILRLINLSMPVFFETTLYIFIFIYGSLAIPVAVIILHQRHSLEQIGISMKNIGAYMVLSIPLSFILGFGEYLTIRSEYLIPDLGFENLLKLTVIMVFFVGLIEELIFRSILQTRLAKALSISESLIITSILFGLMHSGYGTTYEILYTTFVGFLMGLLFYKTKSLPFIAVLHGFINVFLFGIFPHYLSGWTGF
ncbi:CPBP family intramembrane glutamic endopeptidase [Methanosarcina sp. MSH10X1]|uniref:CPBP family intramembrane glutamic endopeptidase n=1 Tax=Methanosarcina sp. MSH10X1 TaxID=2507075 RepID=UPI001F0BE084|nr:type II CAAX endopeptidase family protein [Methanosarcina sp. MSH10X1]